MGKLGPYQCFTVEREPKTIISRKAAKHDEDQCKLFYDVPMTMQDMMMKSSNRYKSKFQKCQRFEAQQRNRHPSPTKYYPQNFTIKPKISSKSSKINWEKPLLYYPNTTVPVKEMMFNKETFPRPAPGRYDPHDVTCKCYLSRCNKRCPGSAVGDGHCHVFQSTAFRLVHPLPVGRKKTSAKPAVVDDNAIQYFRPPRDPISFRVRRSVSTDSLMMTGREIRFNTMVKKKNLFSVKTGRPVAFLAATPRFRESSEISLKLETEKKKLATVDMQQDKPRRKAITKKRLSELAAPKNPLPRIASGKANIYEPLQPSALPEKITIVESVSGLSEVSLEVDANDQAAFTIGVVVRGEEAVESSTE